MENLATIQVISQVDKHPNADSLDIVQVLGYKCIVKKDQWKVGDKVILSLPIPFYRQENGLNHIKSIVRIGLNQ